MSNRDPLLRRGDARTRRGAPEHVWICRHCGRRSYAKKDPIAHERRENVYDPERLGVVRRYFWCGPFDRYLCTLDTAKPQRDATPMSHLGTPSKSDDVWDEDEGWHADDEVPF
jgi:hypothetical protein